MHASDLLESTIAAHGGRQRWQNIERIDAAFSSAGLAFGLHLQPWALRGLRMTLWPHARRVMLHDFCRRGWQGVWTPQHVGIYDAQQRLVAERQQPRASFSRLDRQIRWDKLDILYFAGYALWNYLGFPFILAQPGVALVAATQSPDGLSRQLVARFDADFPTHSALQTFHLDGAGLLTRHDYTADVIGAWAKAANFCLASQQVDGLRFYTRRQVYPRLGERIVLPGPRLVRIELDDLSLSPA